VLSGKLHSFAGGVGCRGELVEALDGAAGESGQDHGQVLADRQTESSAALDNGEDRRDLWSCVFVSVVYPVATADSYGRMELSARLFDSSRTGYSRKRVSLSNSESVYLVALPTMLLGSAFA